jgi:putative tryptophan/tyrosine transport system substrate-binding protein
MRRREVMALIGAAIWPLAAGAQQSEKVHRIGILTPAPSDQTPIFSAFRRGLRDLGYIEGLNTRLEFRSARGDSSLLPKLAADLVGLPVDVIVTDGSPAAVAASQATRRIPVVMGTSGADPVHLGLVASMARPGGNVTGLTLMQAPLSAKRLDLLRSIFPQADTFTILLNPHPGSEANLRAVQEAARALGPITLRRVDVATPDALRTIAPDTLRRGSPILVLPDAMFWNNRQTIVTLISVAGVPALYPEREYVDEGGLIAYGPNVPDNFRRAARYVDLILKGANPGDLPIQEPVKIDLVINLKTAKALGVEIPLTLLGRADEVIE